jgi:hypothetical protein
MEWVTRADVGIDRMGCAWLIRRFIDAEAQFVFVQAPYRDLPDGAEAFDIPGVRLSHRSGHASFGTILSEFNLNDPVLKRIARMVDEVDTAQEALVEPAAPGLDLLCLGLRRISRDDNEAVQRGHLIYDALYAQLTAEAAG